METIVIQAKNKATSNYIKKLLRELEGIESVSTLSPSDNEDLAMIMPLIREGQVIMPALKHS